MRILVLTVVHHPEDARVYGRQVRALLTAGHEVDYAAPWTDFGLSSLPGVAAIDAPRARGRDRLRARSWVRRFVLSRASEYSVLIFHNAELVPVLAPFSERVPMVFDVHEDLQAALVDKKWVPSAMVRPIGTWIEKMERRAEDTMHLILAESGYQDRFSMIHPVVPNEPVVPEQTPSPSSRRVVHIGRHSTGRGATDLVKLAELLSNDAEVELYGWADDDVVDILERAQGSRLLRWNGRISNDDGLAALSGAAAGVSALHDLPNYRHSRPTKIVEYMSRGIPVVTTPLPVASEIVQGHDCGVVVPFGDPGAMAQAIRALLADPAERNRLGRNGHQAALNHFNWANSGPQFVRLIERWGR